MLFRNDADPPLDVQRPDPRHGAQEGYDDGPYWIINGTGRAIARRPELAAEVFETVMLGRGAFSIIDDRVVRLD
jgi:hypothetical protein